MTLLLRTREGIGRRIGKLWAPVVSRVSAARHARTFHPDGIVCAGQVTPMPDADDPALAILGLRLRGPVLARFSAALWKGEARWLDVLGIALRFEGEGDQDLLFATIRSPFTMGMAPLATVTDDFFANQYWAVSPFAVSRIGRLKFRLRSLSAPRPEGASRGQALRALVDEGRALWQLEARRVFRTRYAPIARIRLDRVVTEVDQSALRFDPFRVGRGIVPSGLVHAIRPAAYAASQEARPAHEASATHS